MTDDTRPRETATELGSKALGEDLWALVTEQPTHLVASRAIGTVPSPRRQRAAFRLVFADGRVLKGRRFESAGHAARFELLSRHLDPRHFPVVVARRGGAVLTEWVEGSLLARSASRPALLSQAGALQGALHRTALPEELVSEARDRLDRWRPRLERDLAELVGQGGLARVPAERVLALASETVPAAPPDVGLGHGDYCPENLVVRGDILHAVDNESLLVHACDYDLARTWYRWPMTRVQRQAFLAGYRRYRDPGPAAAQATYWTILVLVDAALFRLRAGAPDAERPIGRLDALGRGASRRVARRATR